MTVNNEIKKVVFYLPSLTGGGAERVMVDLANGFSDRGFSVDLVLARAEGPYLNNVSDKIRVIDLKSTSVSKSLPRFYTYLIAEKPFVVISALSHANIIAIITTLLSRISTKLILTEHAPITPLVNAKKYSKSYWIYKLIRYLYNRADHIVCVSEGVSNELRSLIDVPDSFVRTIYNPVRVPEIISKSFELNSHSWFEKYSPPVVISVGRFSEEKDFPNLLKAFKKVVELVDSRLVILGEGELRPLLENLISDLELDSKVLLPGFINNPYSWIKSSSLLVLSSKYEGFGLVLVEAMACGTPVVSTNCPFGPAEILENGKWGKLVPVSDPDALAIAIIEALNDTNQPDVAKRAEYFSIDRAVDSYLELVYSR